MGHVKACPQQSSKQSTTVARTRQAESHEPNPRSLYGSQGDSPWHRASPSRGGRAPALVRLAARRASLSQNCPQVM